MKKKYVLYLNSSSDVDLIDAESYKMYKKKKRKVTYLNFSFYFYNKRLTNKHRIPLLNMKKKEQHLGIIPFSTSIAKIIWVYYRRINSIFLHKKIEKFVILMFLIKSSIIQRPINFSAGLHHGILVYKNLSPTSKHEVSHKCHCVTRRWCDGRWRQTVLWETQIISE